jgi:hypothetical protein
MPATTQPSPRTDQASQLISAKMTIPTGSAIFSGLLGLTGCPLESAKFQLLGQ